MTFFIPPPVLPSSTTSQAPTSPRPGAYPAGAAPRGRGLPGHPVTAAAVAIATVTALAALAAAVDPALTPAGHPHPTLHRTPGEALGIFATNARLLVVPLLLVAGRWPTGRLTRHLGDLVVVALLLANPITIGVALGRFPTALLPYLPHLPLEDAALATATGAWLSRRLAHRGDARPASLLTYAAWTFALTAIAALAETYLVPHAR